MRKLILLPVGTAFSLLLTHPAEGQTFKVLRAKGNRAVIQLPRGMTLEKDMTYTISNEDGASGAGTAVGTGGVDSRAKSLALSGRLFFGSQKSDPGRSISQSDIQFEGRYGWNRGSMEYGPIASFGWKKDDDESARSFRVGGFFDYNLIPNTPATNLVYGVGTALMLGNNSFSIGSDSVSGNGLTLGAGGQMKWFALGNSTALRFDAQVRYESRSMGSSDVTAIGLDLSAGLQAYF